VHKVAAFESVQHHRDRTGAQCIDAETHRIDRTEAGVGYEHHVIGR
jgi:hypothetical protein